MSRRLYTTTYPTHYEKVVLRHLLDGQRFDCVVDAPVIGRQPLFSGDHGDRRNGDNFYLLNVENFEDYLGIVTVSLRYYVPYAEAVVDRAGTIVAFGFLAHAHRPYGFVEATDEPVLEALDAAFSTVFPAPSEDVFRSWTKSSWIDKIRKPWRRLQIQGATLSSLSSA